LAWLNPFRPSLENTPDLKISMIFPATEVVWASFLFFVFCLITVFNPHPVYFGSKQKQHIRKYTKQVNKIIRESPELYQQVVLPYIKRIPPTRLSWWVFCYKWNDI
jgi:hypothetical protein